ncbi:MAG: hypothetical protein BroJett014_31690 [Planctomycetota bacterium]|nr:MAG: hypothetical protein BroJett014_31690 [Planctomycetota bacterium]
MTTATPPNRSGFDVILGNPPWERVKLQEQEFFAQRDPAVAGAPNAAARKKAIAALSDTNPELLAEFQEATRRAEGESHLLRSSGRYPLCGRGDINTYAVFAESMRDAISPAGRLGVIVPTGIATDDTTKFFFGDLVQSRTLVSYFGFKNERFLFPRPVEHTVTFGLLTVVGRALSSQQMQFCWIAWTPEEMADPARRIVLTAEDIERLNPNTRTCPVFRSERDAEITKAIYRRVPVLIREATETTPEANPWGLTFMAMFHMANSSNLFIAPEAACPEVAKAVAEEPDEPPPFLPLYEAKMLHQFDHRWATYAREGAGWLDTPILTKINKDGREEPDTRDLSTAEKDRPVVFAAPRYWVSAAEVEARLIKTDKDGNVTWRWEREWLLGFRDIARATDDRTLISTVIPRTGISNKIPLMVFDDLDAKQAACLIACMNSFAVDYSARQKVGGATLNFFIVKQFPVLPPSAFAAACPWDESQSLADWIAPRVLELVYTAHDLAGFARDLGYEGPPFRWDPARRAQIRAELDAAFFHLYGVSRDDAAYIMDTFLVFKARDEERNGGVYRTKETILAIYDEMADAMSGTAPAPAVRPTLAATPSFLPPTTAQVQQGRAAAYLTLLAATWAKPIERQAIEYGLVLMLNDALRAKVLAQPRASAGAGLYPAWPAVAAANQAPPGPATQYVRGLDAMLGSLNANGVVRVTTSSGPHGGMQRVELGATGQAMVQTLPPADQSKAREAVAAFEILKSNLQRLESFVPAAELEFTVV